MEGSSFSFFNLVPNFYAAFGAQEVDSAEVFSAQVVWILLFVFVVFLVYSCSKFFSAKRHINFYIDLVKGLDPGALLEHQRDLLSKSKENSKYYHTWREFNESLVVSDQKSNPRLCNTLDAAFFFNTSALSRSLTENRLLAAVPGFLTAIGVIGTFAGLQMGLSSLELGANADVADVRDGIGTVIAGASIAFLTSVWGVFLSVSFNFIEKILERRIRKKITFLQIRIDELFPRYTAESALVEISDSSRISQETMQGLAEQIGNKMQEALVESSNAISQGLEDALNRIMAPAIQSLAENATNANKGSEEALGSLLERFMDGVGQAGNEQRRALDAASNDVKDAVQAMGEQMSNFVSQLGQRTVDDQVRQQEQQALMDQREQTQADKIKGQFDVVMERASEAVGQVGQSVISQVDSLKQLDSERQAQLSQSVQQFNDQNTSLNERISGLADTQASMHEQVVQQLNELYSSFTEVVSGNKQASEAILLSSKEMNSSSNQLGLLSSNVKDASVSLGDQVLKAADATVSMAERSEEVSQRISTTLSGLQDVVQSIEVVSQSFQSSSELVDKSITGIEGHLDNAMNAMKVHIYELEKQVAELLTNYSSQVSGQTTDRLREWNEQTNEFSSAMKDVVTAMSNVVDEIETKMSH